MHHGAHRVAEATMRPAPVQSHIPTWIAGRAPHAKPLERARWNGDVPIARPLPTARFQQRSNRSSTTTIGP
jgi:alkanesulfonate monooxygenase SsuD/methylene tetrahydromethanopterin reductase-like flavin-dependent oxidoreductase (luciferase family)